jgi:plasmid stabilization system protein ParE
MTTPHFDLIIRRTAVREIASQTQYYRKRASKELAAAWDAAINEALLSLRTLPNRGAPVTASRKALSNIRKLAVPSFPKHFLFYQTDTAAQTVTVIRMLHGARNLEPWLAAAERE